MKWAKNQGFKTADFKGFRIDGAAAKPGTTQGENKVYDLSKY